LGDILGACAEQVFKLDIAEFLNDREFLLDALSESFFKILQLSFFLVHVLDEASSSLLHLVEATLQAGPVRCLVALAMLNLLLLNSILRMPDVVSNELFDGVTPILAEVVVLQRLDFVDQSVHILNKDIVASNEHTFLVFDCARVGGADLICARYRLLRFQLQLGILRLSHIGL